MSFAALTVATVFLLLAAWLRASGTAVTRLPRADALRDASEEVKGAETIARLLDDREAVGPAVGAVASALLVLASVVATAVLARVESLSTSVLVALGVGAVAFMVGDLLPRGLGRISPAKLAYRSHGLLRSAVALGGWANDLLPDVEIEGVDEEDDEEDEADEAERDLIDSVLEFGETIVREVMTPRPDMISVPVTASIDELIDISTDAGFSRLPVISSDDVVGMAMVKDLLTMLTDDGERPNSVAEVMRPAEFVPETKLAASLLSEMQESHHHQMMVVDEYGDVVGLVTIEDLLEELVGEIADETDAEEDLVTPTRGGWVMDARLPVDDFCKVAKVNAPDHEGDTLAGLVFALAERVPEEGESFAFENLTITVTRMQGRRVAEVKVTAGQSV